MWHVTRDMWHVTCDTFNFFILFIFFYHPPPTKISVLWSASVERFSVSRMRDFYSMSDINIHTSRLLDQLGPEGRVGENIIDVKCPIQHLSSVCQVLSYRLSVVAKLADFTVRLLMYYCQVLSYWLSVVAKLADFTVWLSMSYCPNVPTVLLS